MDKDWLDRNRIYFIPIHTQKYCGDVFIVIRAHDDKQAWDLVQKILNNEDEEMLPQWYGRDPEGFDLAALNGGIMCYLLE